MDTGFKKDFGRRMTGVGLVMALFVAAGIGGLWDAAGVADEARSGRQLISSGSKYEEMAAYSRAVVDGDWIFVSGTVGFDPKTGDIPDDFDAQMDQIFANISAALAKADASLGDIVRVRCFLVDAHDVEAMSRGLRKYLSDVRPTNTTIVVGLAADDAKIEIEVTALRRHPAEPSSGPGQ